MNKLYNILRSIIPVFITEYCYAQYDEYEEVCDLIEASLAEQEGSDIYMDAYGEVKGIFWLGHMWFSTFTPIDD